MYEITLAILNLYDIVCHLYLNKAGGETEQLLCKAVITETEWPDINSKKTEELHETI